MKGLKSAARRQARADRTVRVEQDYFHFTHKTTRILAEKMGIFLLGVRVVLEELLLFIFLSTVWNFIKGNMQYR